jgi:hypothetical protein
MIQQVLLHFGGVLLLQLTVLAGLAGLAGLAVLAGLAGLAVDRRLQVFF